MCVLKKMCVVLEHYELVFNITLSELDKSGMALQLNIGRKFRHSLLASSY